MALSIQPRCSCKNGYVESLNGRLRDELLKSELFQTVTEARVVIERWRER